MCLFLIASELCTSFMCDCQNISKVSVYLASWIPFSTVHWQICFISEVVQLQLLWCAAVQMHDMENQIAIANRRATEAENRVCTVVV